VGLTGLGVLCCWAVVFHECQVQQMPWHWSSWAARATLFIRASAVISGAVDPIAQLESIPPSDVWRMQRTIAEHAHCLHYRRARADGGEEPERAAWVGRAANGTLAGATDAFDITLEAVQAVAEGRGTESLCQRVPWPHAP
jgi:hypothetical protein